MTSATPRLRHQLTLFVPVKHAPAIEAVRKVLDPVQAALIPAHVTLCREDEITSLLNDLTSEGSSNLDAQVLALRRADRLAPLNLQFGAAEAFDGHGWQLPCVQGEADFMQCRRALLARDDVRPARAHITLAHPRNPVAPGNTRVEAQKLAAGSALEFRVLALIEQRDGGPWQTLATWPMCSAATDFSALELPESAAGLTPQWMRLADAARLQAFYESNPHYFQMVLGQPAEPTAAWEDIAGPLPPGWPYADRCSIGWVDASGALQGFCTVVRDLLEAGVWHIGLFLMATAVHGQGQARAVHASIERWAARHGARWLRLGVVHGNARGQRFWARNGYVEVRQRHDVQYGELRHTLGVLIKPLPGHSIEDYLRQVPRDRPED